MSFRITGLDPFHFKSLIGAPETELAQLGVRRVVVEAPTSAPCRISLDDAEVGETVLLLSYSHQPNPTPYQQQGPIFIREHSARFESTDVMPPALARRTLSLRAFDAAHMMIDADVVEGTDAPTLINRFFENPDVAYVQAHYARRGCFAAAIERV